MNFKFKKTETNRIENTNELLTALIFDVLSLFSLFAQL